MILIYDKSVRTTSNRAQLGLCVKFVAPAANKTFENMVKFNYSHPSL
jgi:hypothetical protein